MSGPVETRQGFRVTESPLTDPRSLGGSALFHGLLFAVASLSVLSVALPRGQGVDSHRVLTGEIEPAVDNRAPKVAGEGGGSAGELGGLGSEVFRISSDGADPNGGTRTSAADALISDILPDTTPKPSDSLERALPGLETSGFGVLPGDGAGGGGGSGGGSGGGMGSGIGPGTEFFGAREHGRSFAYVIDCSGSMALRSSLEVAKRELLASLDRLPPDVRFMVVLYNDEAKVLADAQGRAGLMPATVSNKTRVRTQLAQVPPFGGTDHKTALAAAFQAKPEVIFFLTDADMLPNSDVDEMLKDAGKSRIQAVEFGGGPDLGHDTPLRRLAKDSGGTYRYIDVHKFPKTSL
jgi:hypothetical protein